MFKVPLPLFAWFFIQFGKLIRRPLGPLCPSSTPPPSPFVIFYCSQNSVFFKTMASFGETKRSRQG